MCWLDCHIYAKLICNGRIMHLIEFYLIDNWHFTSLYSFAHLVLFNWIAFFSKKIALKAIYQHWLFNINFACTECLRVLLDLLLYQVLQPQSSLFSVWHSDKTTQSSLSASLQMVKCSLCVHLLCHGTRLDLDVWNFDHDKILYERSKMLTPQMPAGKLACKTRTKH